MPNKIPHWETFQQEDTGYREAATIILNEFRAEVDTNALHSNGENALYILAGLKAATARDIYCVMKPKGEKYSIRPTIGIAVRLLGEHNQQVGESKKVVIPFSDGYIRDFLKRRQRISIITGAYSAYQAELLYDLEQSQHPEIQGGCTEELEKIRDRFAMLSESWVQYS